MSYNGAGVFSILNSFSPNTTILSAAVNANFTDIATGLSDVLTRDNQLGMAAPLRHSSGTSAAPSITFTSNTPTGAYLRGTSNLGLVANTVGISLNQQGMRAATAVIAAGGANYAVGDTITLTGGTATYPVILTVATLSGSAVATVTIADAGLYDVIASSPVAQGSTSGSGSAATFTLTWTATTLISDLVGSGTLWGSLGMSSYMSGLVRTLSLANLQTALGILTLSNQFPALPRGYIDGFILSVASTTTIGINSGRCRSGDDAKNIALASAFTKSTSSWAAGTGNGGLDTGSIASTTWYYVYGIYNPTTDVSDVLFTATYAAATMPSGYTKSRYVGAVLTDGSSHFTAFTQIGNWFRWTTIPSVDVSTTTLTTSSSTFSLASVPLLLSVLGIFDVACSNAATSVVYIRNTNETDTAPSTTAAPLGNAGFGGGSAGINAIGQVQVWTTNTGTIAARATAANTTLRMAVIGWMDLRGTDQ